MSRASVGGDYPRPVAYNPPDVTTAFHSAGAAARAAVVLGHGAGAGQRHPFMVAVGEGLASRGIHVLTFDFPYMEARRRSPDPGPVLEQAFSDAVRVAAGRADVARLPLFAGGKSMGGRIASQAAARGLLPAVKGLVYLGYPLHPPGKASQLRDRHLPDVPMPMLFVQGSRDAFGTPEELRPVLDRLGARATLVVVDGGDHSFAVPKSAGRSQQQVIGSILDAAAEWIQSILTRPRSACPP